MSEFITKLQTLCAAEAAAAHGDADRFGEMIEGLARALGFSIAIAARGDGKTIDTMVEGATNYALGEAVGKAPFARFMSDARSRP